MAVTTTPEISVKGASGARYSVKVYRWGTSFKPVGAVYLILRKEKNGNYTLLYVVQTSDLSSRFDNHHKQSCFDRNRKTHIAVNVQGSEAMRFSIETDLVRAYQPPCND